MIPIEFFFQIAAIQKEAIADVTLEFPASQNFSDRASGLAAPQFELEQPVARDVVTLREKQVRLVLGIDMRDSPVILQDFDGLSESCDGEFFGGTGSRAQRRKRYEKGKREGSGTMNALHRSPPLQQLFA